MKRTVFAMVVIAAMCCPAVAGAEAACRAACSWSDWGERTEVCAAPSEGILEAMLACWTAPEASGGCATSCASWLADYNACASSGAPACTMGLESPACDSCMYGACGAVTNACSVDETECVPCADWIGGGFDPSYLCAHSIVPGIDLSECACGACASKCASACGAYFEPDLANFQCGVCLAGTGCGAQYSTCVAN